MLQFFDLHTMTTRGIMRPPSVSAGATNSAAKTSLSPSPTYLQPIPRLTFSSPRKTFRKMTILRCGGSIPRILRPCRPQSLLRTRYPIPLHRAFSACPSLWGMRSQVLKDVGEGESHPGYGFGSIADRSQVSPRSRLSSGTLRRVHTSRNGSPCVSTSRIKRWMMWVFSLNLLSTLDC